MKANQAQLLRLLKGSDQFTIPIYQRTYSWQAKQCQQLFDDIVRVGKDEKAISHFIGSIVYFEPGIYTTTSFSQSLVIDGQQRLTTVSLLLLALTHCLKEREDVTLEDESWEEVRETYLINKHRTGDTKYKLLLTRKDKATFTKLIDGIEVDDGRSQPVLDNYQFFKGKLHAENIQTVYRGIKKLVIIDVALEKGKDNPQLIFESLNSTGLDLSQADLIRNYILMGQSIENQNTLYEKHWYPMEQSFGENLDALAGFIRDYLTMKQSLIPKIGLVYENYKNFLSAEDDFESMAEAVEDLHMYSKFYVRIALQKEEEPDIAKKLEEVAKLEINTSYPFLLAIYNDYEEGKITKGEFIEIIDLVANYVFRRAICGIPPNSLNKTFATLYKNIKHETYLESVRAAFLLMEGNRRFPPDAEFVRELQIKNVYNFWSNNYLLESLENWRRKELVNAENYTIEHILPQNEKISQEWQAEIGEDWQSVKEKYLHTLGNLTLTGYNPQLSDRPFSEKKTIEGGFNASPLFLNESVREARRWDETAILNRATKLAERACIVWQRPVVSDDRLEFYKEKKKQTIYNLEHYEYLQDDMLDFYKNLESRVMNLDASVCVKYNKWSISFNAQANFANVRSRKGSLKLFLSTDFDKIRDPRGMCRDVSGLRRWGNVKVGLENLGDLDYVMELIKQAFEEQAGSA